MGWLSKLLGSAPPPESFYQVEELTPEQKAERRRELIKKVRKLEIFTRRVVNDQLAGSYHSVFKGRGMDFDEVRPYQPGDEIRFIDWNVSARSPDIYIKQFVEERELTVFLLIDASASQYFGTGSKTKREAAAELSALMAFSATKNNDRVGLIIFTDQIEVFVPPKKGRKHVLRIISQILEFQPKETGTNIAEALDYFARMCKRRSVAFLISDFQDSGYERALHIVSRRHDIVPLVLIDPAEEELPAIGTAWFEDPETREVLAVDTQSRTGRRRYREMVLSVRQRREKLLRRMKVDAVHVETNKSFLEPLVNYFRLRAKRF